MKTLAEISIDAGLVARAAAAGAGRLAEERRVPLVVVLVRELGVDELALVAALHKHARAPVVDPAAVAVDPEALRQLPAEACARLRALPLALGDGPGERTVRVAMADPTDTAAIAELEQLGRCELEVVVLPLSTVEELVERGYRALSTAVVPRPARGALAPVPRHAGGAPRGAPGAGPPAGAVAAGLAERAAADDGEISVTAQIPVTALIGGGAEEPDLETRVAALIHVLTTRGLLTEAELADAVRALRRRPGDG